jgi:hypothetical protein
MAYRLRLLGLAHPCSPVFYAPFRRRSQVVRQRLQMGSALFFPFFHIVLRSPL